MARATIQLVEDLAQYVLDKDGLGLTPSEVEFIQRLATQTKFSVDEVVKLEQIYYFLIDNEYIKGAFYV